MSKTPISALKEYCERRKVGPIVYHFSNVANKGFICIITLEGQQAQAHDRTKQGAKHMASLQMLRKMKDFVNDNLAAVNKLPKQKDSNIEQLIQKMKRLNLDVHKELRDYCLYRDLPQPNIEIFEQAGTTDAPEYVACCNLASMTISAKSENKKEARQRAAMKVFTIIANDTDNMPPTNKKFPALSAVEDLEAQRRTMFQTYNSVVNTDANDVPTKKGLRICNRHDFFKNYDPHLKEAAFKVLHSEEYASLKDKALAILGALKLTPSFSELDANSTEKLLIMELEDCSYDCVIIGLENRIYYQIIRYFRDMLS